METKQRRGRPRKDPNRAIRHGRMVNLATEHGPWVQPRFSRVTYRELKRAAKQDGLAITAWIRRNCEAALA